MKYQSCFLEEVKRNNIDMSSAGFTPESGKVYGKFIHFQERLLR